MRCGVLCFLCVNAAPCARGKTPVCRMLNTCARFCRYTRKRFESTHGSFFTLHTNKHTTTTQKQHSNNTAATQQHPATLTSLSHSLILSFSLTHSLPLLSLVPLSLSLSPSFSPPLFLSFSFSVLFTLVFPLFFLSNNDNDHSFSRISFLHMALTCLNVSVRGLRSIPCLAKHVRIMQETTVLGINVQASCHLE